MVYSIWYTVYGIQYMVYSIWFTVYGIQYMVYSIWYTVYGIQPKVDNRHSLHRKAVPEDDAYRLHEHLYGCGETCSPKSLFDCRGVWVTRGYRLSRFDCMLHAICHVLYIINTVFA
jgi:hypothetical protein